MGICDRGLGTYSTTNPTPIMPVWERPNATGNNSLRWDLSTYRVELALRHATDAVRAEVGVAHLDAAQAAEVLETLLLPLRRQLCVHELRVYAEVVERPADLLLLVVEVEQVARPLVVDLESEPLGSTEKTEWATTLGAACEFRTMGSWHILMSYT